MKRFLPAALLCLAATTQAQAATMTFEGLRDVIYDTTYYEAGITASGIFGLAAYGTDSVHLDDFGTAASSTVSFTMASRFNAISFEIVGGSFMMTLCDESYSCFSPTYKNVLVQGYRGRTEVASLLFDMSFAPSVITLGSTFTRLSKLKISVVIPREYAVRLDSGEVWCAAPCSHFSIDNVVLAPVPVPPAMPLLGGALGLVALAARRRRAA